MSVSRRSFLAAAPAATLILPRRLDAFTATGTQTSVPATFPSHEPALVRDIVGASHGNIARVRELLAEHPALAKASWDWGWGDWESALGAASHVGNREIAQLLIEHGARPDLFSAAMLGQVDVVKAFVAAAPGIQRTYGPHGITLLSHARAGGASAVVAFLEALGDADIEYPSEPLNDRDRDAIVGTYVFGSGAHDRFIATVHPRFGLQLERDQQPPRRLVHLGNRIFHPIGGTAVRITFAGGAPAPSLQAVDGKISIAATRA
jgi:hypothetical protein